MSKQVVLDRVRVLNKHLTKKVLTHISGKKFGHFTILSHTERKTGKGYKTPIIKSNSTTIALIGGGAVDHFQSAMIQSY